ncbi:hypothetical protein T4B_10194 [Trichinella pseudospiralis]|uniref:Uncharacterized protein n=1 Tax=Trichinella pseudospiralis TaxID=6337 RepID=A0A0V1DUI5_TRIPS|nr:hypothetical protein T4A_9580 [Trichinella pseudospiralis]KRZ03283.1 hypothetical protein T4B_10194 [Trichinella pseudospiralis]KRZ35347.1 hypothetical protein T4C_9974 [Trichinella pseudospiralis]
MNCSYFHTAVLMQIGTIPGTASQASERPMAGTMAEHVLATSIAILVIALFGSAQFSMSTSVIYNL